MPLHSFVAKTLGEETMNKIDKASDKKVDPTDPRQAAFVAGGITGAVAGATLGSVGGPVGAIAGAVVGGLSGAKTAESIAIDTAAENHYWQGAYKTRPYTLSDSDFDDYEPAYRAGYDLPEDIYLDNDATFENTEPMLRKKYESDPDVRLPWDSARPATKDAFERVIKNRVR